MAHLDLGLTDVSSRGGCGPDCACGHGDAHGAAGRAADRSSFVVEGMTCAHCVASVTEELEALGGVEGVSVELVPGGASTVAVRASRPLAVAEVRAAVEDAGYRLIDA